MRKRTPSEKKYTTLGVGGGSGDSTRIWGMLESWREQIRTKLFPSFLFLLRDFENLYKFLMDVNLSKITRITSCQKPCTYKEYRFMNTIPRDYNFYTFPHNQNAFFLWSVSQDTQMEMEFLVYSFDSLGVSFMTIWDIVVWAMNHKKHVNIQIPVCPLIQGHFSSNLLWGYVWIALTYS